MNTRKTVQLISLDEVIENIFSEELRESHDSPTETIWATFDRSFTWGDTSHSLVGNNMALSFIEDALEEEGWDQTAIAQVAEKYWQFVGEDTWIDLATF